MSLTERKIKYLEAGKSRQIVWDNGGFGMQIAPDGEKSFVMEYRFNEMTKVITLGIYPQMSLDIAKQQAVKAYEMIIKGVDPEEKGLPTPGAGAAAADPSADALDQIKDKAASTYEDIKGKATEQIEKIKTSDTLDKFKGLASKKLDKIRERVEKKVKQAQGIKPEPAAKIIPLETRTQPPKEKTPAPPPPPKPAEKKVVSPASQDKRPEKTAKAPSIRDNYGRVLDKSELKTLWASLQNSDMSKQSQLAVKMLMVTAQNPSDVVASRGADFDLMSKWWEIHGSLTASGKKHKVPLSNLAVDLLRKIQELSGMTGVLFPVPGGVTPMEIGKLEDDVRRMQVRFGMKPFSLNDLQNSLVVQMLDNKISEPVLYSILNQKLPPGTPVGAPKVTDRDLRDAMEKLERQLPKAY